MKVTRWLVVNEFEQPAVPVTDTPPVTDATVEAAPAGVANPIDPPVPSEPNPHPVDPVRTAAGRLGGKRVHRLAELGREYEREHGLKAGRQRLKQLVQPGKRYEVEHGLRAATPKRRRQGDAWPEFLAALARVVKPAYRPAVEQPAAALRPGPKGIAADTDQAA
jgi:hypothetical protein